MFAGPGNIGMTKMVSERRAVEVLDAEFLTIRAKVLEVAAALDRLDRAAGSVAHEARRAQLQAAIQILVRSEDDRAEQVQLIFSRQYEGDWRKKFGV